MTDSENTRDLLAASFEALDRYEEEREALVASGDRQPVPGDVYVMEVTRDLGIEWAVIAQDPADSSRLLVVPGDGHVLAGSADVELADDSPLGALKLRCRFGTWTHAALLRPDLWVGLLETMELIEARQRWLDAGDDLAKGEEEAGDVIGREVDEDPSYQDWVDEVLLPARQALIEAQEEAERPEGVVDDDAAKKVGEPPKARNARARKRRNSMVLRIAASVVVAVASVQILRLSERVGDLETMSRRAEEKHGVVVGRLETERDQLTAERDRLRLRQRELEATGAAREEETEELRGRIADLDRRLGAAEQDAQVVNPSIVFFQPPDEVQRGTVEVTISPEQSDLIVFMALRERSPAPRYRLEVRVKDAEETLWSTDRLVVQDPGEIRVGLPVEVLKRGRYELELLALEEARERRVAVYELVILLANER